MLGGLKGKQGLFVYIFGRNPNNSIELYLKKVAAAPALER